MKKISLSSVLLCVTLALLPSCSTPDYSPVPQSGTVTDATDWESKLVLDEKNGDCLDIAIENTGDFSISVVLNETEVQVFAPSEKGTLEFDVDGNHFKADLKVVPKHSGEVSFQYAISQHDTP